MSLNDFWRREKHVALNAQSRRFRIIKWLIILLIAALLYYLFGWKIVVISFLTLCTVGVAVHFLLRYMTDGWTRSWGPYKRIKLDGE